MIRSKEIDALWSRNGADLRRMAAHIAAILTHRHGSEYAANVYLRIVGLPLVTPRQIDA